MRFVFHKTRTTPDANKKIFLRSAISQSIYNTIFGYQCGLKCVRIRTAGLYGKLFVHARKLQLYYMCVHVRVRV